MVKMSKVSLYVNTIDDIVLIARLIFSGILLNNIRWFMLTSSNFLPKQISLKIWQKKDSHIINCDIYYIKTKFIKKNINFFFKVFEIEQKRYLSFFSYSVKKKQSKRKIQKLLIAYKIG